MVLLDYKHFDFSDDAGTGNNSSFAIKIVFFGPNSTGTSGNDRFDNISFSGIPLATNPLSVSVSADRTTICSNATVTFTATATNAGTSPSYEWKKNNTNVGTNNSTYTDNIFQDKDTITCIVFSANSSSATSNKVGITVVANTLSIPNLSKNNPSACGNNDDGDITINRLGGVSPFQYSLGNINYGSSNLFTNLPQGTYTAYVKDVRGCTASLAGVLTKAAPIVVTISKVAPSACGGNNGSITISNTGGTAPFKFSLNNSNYSTNSVYSNLSSGNYTAYVQDADNCITSVVVALANASALTITSLTKNNPSACSATNGSISVHITGGTAPFVYSLDNTVFASNSNFSNLAAGTYNVYVKDANGCTATTTDVLVNPSSPSISSLTTTPPSTCVTNDGSITINSAGGASPFQYSLNNVNYSSSANFTDLSPGTYTAYVKDANGCMATFTDKIDDHVSSFSLLNLNGKSASACRNDGSITINAQGGYTPYEFSLDNVNYSTDNVFSNLPGGTYTAYIRDAQGCVITNTDVLEKVSPVIITLTKTLVSACINDGTFTINTTQGRAPLLYSLNDVNYSGNNFFTDLPSGPFTAYVKDNDGCTTSVSETLSKIEWQLSLNKTSPSSCANNGSITATTSGGIAPFTFSLDNVHFFTSNVFTGLAAGDYTVYVQDANGCTTSTTETLAGIRYFYHYKFGQNSIFGV